MENFIGSNESIILFGGLAVLSAFLASRQDKKAREAARKNPKPPGLYDVDVQYWRERYFFRKNWYRFLLAASLFCFGIMAWDLLKSKPLLDNFIDAPHPIQQLPGLYWSGGGIIYGTMFLFFAAVFAYSYFKLFKRFIWFRCPSPSCNVTISTWEEWKCPYCPKERGVNDGTKRSFFDKCSYCGARPDAHQCPSCGFVFETNHLVKDGGKIFKYSKRPDVYLSPLYAISQQQPVKEEKPFIPDGIPFKDRFAHTLVIASPGWGKTQLLQRLAYYDLQAHSTVVVVDSQGEGSGKFIHNVLRLRDKGDLIYIDFTDPVHIPCLSMFDVKLGSDPKERERILNGTLELYNYVFSSLLGANLTMRQSTMLSMLSRLMIEIPGANLRTLYDAIRNPGAFSREVGRLQGAARAYFETEFNDKKMKEVKEQVADRIYGIMGNASLERIFTQPKSKIDLYKAINGGKTIVVNTSVAHLGQENSSILGRFFIVMLFQAALRREGELDRMKSAFLYIDEAWQYFDEKLPELYALARKFRLGLVLASQYIAQFTEKSTLLRNAAFSSAILFAGQVSAKEDHEMAKELSLGKDGTTRNLEQDDELGKPVSSEFYYRLQGKPGQVKKIPFYVMENAPSLSAGEFKDMLEENTARYCESVRAKKAEAKADETVLEPDEKGTLRPVPPTLGVDDKNEFWHR